MNEKYFLQTICIVFLSFGSCNKPIKLPKGYWISEQGNPSILISDEGNNKYTATVFFSCSNGIVCPIKYKIIHNSFGMYIQAEGRIIIIYSEVSNKLFLSPGGNYHRSVQSKKHE